MKKARNLPIAVTKLTIERLDDGGKTQDPGYVRRVK
jgi:hypothetical protein